MLEVYLRLRVCLSWDEYAMQSAYAFSLMMRFTYPFHLHLLILHTLLILSGVPQRSAGRLWGLALGFDGWVG